MLKTVGKILLSCSIYALISHNVLGVNYGDQFTTLMTAARSFAIYSVLFLGYSGIPLIISLLVARAPKANRKKPISPFINSALLIGWIIALVFLWGGWNANRVIHQTNEENTLERTPSKEIIEKIVKEEVERISRQAPIVIDSHTNLASVTYINGSANFLYQFHSLDAKDIDNELFAKKTAEFSRNKFCTDPSTKMFRDLASETVINWKYVDSKGVVITSFTMKGSECEKP